ncbi:MAG: DUF1573 domain-containing protein [Planctomycetota bacterium]
MLRPLVSTLLALLLAGLAAAQTPKIVIEGEARWDFGRLEQGEKREMTFVIRNPGDAELVIDKIGVTCGCVSVKETQARVPAGGRYEVVASLDSTRVAGVIAKEIFLTSNAPGRPRISIEVKGEILSPWWIVGGTGIVFGELDAGVVTTRSLRIQVRRGLDLELKRLYSSSPNVLAEAVPFGKPEDEEHGFELRLTVDGKAPAGRTLRADVSFELNAKYKTNGFVTVHAEIKGPLIVSPDRIPFGGIKRGETATKVVRIEKRKGDGLVIEKVFCSDKQVSWTVKEVAAGRAFAITFTLTPEAGKTQISGRVHVKTNDPQQGLIVLPYRAAIRP